MAQETDPFNQVYRGQEGTGAAFLLSGNKAAEIFNSNIDQMQQQRRMEAFQRQKAAQQQRDTSAKFLADAKVGNHWQHDNKEILDFHDKNIKQYGAQLITEGKNPHTDPTFLSNVQKGTAMAGYSKQAEENFNKFYQTYLKDPNKIENSDEILTYYTRPLAERMASGVLPPKPIFRYTLTDAINDSGGKVSYIKNNDGTFDTTTINRSGIIDQAIGSLDLDAAKYLIRKKGGDIGAFNQGFPVKTQDGKRLWNTQGKEFESVVANVLDETPEFVDYLKSKGYDTKDEKATFESALDYASKQNKAVGGYIADYTNKIAGTGTTDRKRVYTAVANRRADATQQRLSDKGKSGDETATFRQDWISDMFDGVPGSGEKLKAALKGNASFNGGELKIGRVPGSNTKLIFSIPAKVVQSTDESGNVSKKTFPARTITIDKNNPDDKITLNQLINDITKENVNISQLMTEGGKKKVADGKGADDMIKPGKAQSIPAKKKQESLRNKYNY